MFFARRYKEWLLLAIGAPLGFAGSPTTLSTPLLLNPPAVGGKALTFSSTVTAFLGEITFVVDGVPTRPQTIDAGGVAAITQAFTIGTHTISARYVDDTLIPVYLPSSSATLSLFVDKAATVLEMAYSAGQLIQPVVIRATPIVPNPVGGAPFPVAGTVDFANAGTPISGCFGIPVLGGVAVCNTRLGQAGTFTISAAYSGDANTKPSTASLQVTTSKVVAGIYTAATSASPVFGAPLGINTLLLGADGAPAATGTVTYSDRAAALATIAVGTDGRASLVMPLTIGAHSIVAVYNGDANYQTSTAAALDVVVAKASTVLALASTPAQIWQPVTLKAAVTVVSPGNAPTGGSLDFAAEWNRNL